MTKLAPLPDASIYDGLEKFNLPFDGQTFPSALLPIFDTLVAKHKPTAIIEVGSHKGGSAVRWAKAAGPGCLIYCVDTWLESADGYLVDPATKNYKIHHQNGHPMTYWQFLNNMKALGYSQQVVPIVNTSAEGAIILAAHNIRAQIIYIDGTHTFRGAYWDISDYWPLLAPGGAMLMDDLVLYPDVYAACLRFVAENNLWKNFEPVENRTFGLLTKE